MAPHWRRSRHKSPSRRRRLFLSGVGDKKLTATFCRRQQKVTQRRHFVDVDFDASVVDRLLFHRPHICDLGLSIIVNIVTISIIVTRTLQMPKDNTLVEN